MPKKAKNPQVTDKVDLKDIVLLPDEPVTGHTQDELGMKPFSEIVAGAAWGTKGPFTIGIFGKWGEGKTSVLKQAKSLIEAAHPEAITVWFNAWQFDYEEHPLVPLALTIAEQVEAKIPKSERHSQAGRWITLRELGAALRAVVAGMTVKTPVLDFSGKEWLAEVDALADGDRDLSLSPTLYLRAFALLQSACRGSGDQKGAMCPPIVVFIDDLDRCLPRRALRLLQSIRLVLGQPGFVFVLALDREPVVRHLQTEFQKLQMEDPLASARAYLDKMIQLSLWVPTHETRFFQYIDGLLKREEISENVIVHGAILQLKEMLAAGTGANPRSMVRLVNNLVVDERFWTRTKDQVTAEWLGLCAISRLLRERLEPGDYAVLVRQTDLCEELAAQDKPREAFWFSAAGKTPETRTGVERARFGIGRRLDLEPSIDALLKTPIGRRWLTDHTARLEVEQFLVSERREEAPVEVSGLAAIGDAIRKTLGLNPSVPIGDAHRSTVRSLRLTMPPVGVDDLPDLENLPLLTTLAVTGEGLSDACLPHIAKLAALTRLMLLGHNIVGTGLDHLVRLGMLTSLDLTDTQVTDAGLEHVGKLGSLTSLDLTGTKVEDAGLEYLKGLKSLTFLSLWKTRVTDAGLEHLRELVSITSLDLMRTRVTDAGLEHLSGLTALTSLDLRTTEVTGAGLAHLENLKELRTLHISGAQLTDAGLEGLGRLPSLTSLTLWGARVTDAGLEHLKGLTALTSLDLRRTSVTDASLEHLKRLTSLVRLDLGHTQVTDAGLVHLEKLTALTGLYLSMTQVTDAGVAKLKEALPNLNVER